MRIEFCLSLSLSLHIFFQSLSFLYFICQIPSALRSSTYYLCLITVHVSFGLASLTFSKVSLFFLTFYLNSVFLSPRLFISISLTSFVKKSVFPAVCSFTSLIPFLLVCLFFSVYLLSVRPFLCRFACLQRNTLSDGPRVTR